MICALSAAVVAVLKDAIYAEKSLENNRLIMLRIYNKDSREFVNKSN